MSKIEKYVNARVEHKHDIKANWDQAENFIPKNGEWIFYDPDENCSYRRAKIGDGITNVINLPFADEHIQEELDTKVPRIVDIDKADWEEDFEKNVAAGMPENWIEWSGTFTVDGKKYTKSAGNGFAYDYNNNNRVYVEKSTSGWNGNGGGVYNKYPLTASPDKVPDPDPKDWIWGTDSNGNTVPVAPKNYMQSIPMRYQTGDILVPNEPSYSNSAISKTYADTKDNEIRAEILNSKNEILNSTANAIKANAEGSLIILDDVNPESATVKVTGEPNSKVYAHGENLARSSTETASGTGSWVSTGYSIHPIKNRTYILSCDFERISGTTVGIAIKPNGTSVITEPSSSEVSGTLTTTVDVGDASTINLMFYSNYSGTAQASECKFSNIVCRLADMDVELGTEGCEEQVCTLDENGEGNVNVPNCSPALIYNPDSKVLYVEYNKDIEKEFVSKLSELDIENSNLREYYIADGEILTGIGNSIELASEQYIIVQAKAISGSGYTNSDWSYIDSEGNPIAPPDPIPLTPWEGAIPTPIITLSEPDENGIRIATWEANENAESYNCRIGTIVQPYSTEYSCFAKRERVYVQDSYGDVYTRYSLTWDGRPIESPNAGRYGNPKNRMSSITQRLPYGFVKVPAYKRADIENMKEEYGIHDGDIAKCTAPIAYVDETLELAKDYADSLSNDCANAINTTKINSLLILDDVSPLETEISIHSIEPSTVIRVSGANFAYASTITSKGSTSWRSNMINAYVPQNHNYILSCDFVKVAGNTVGIAIKPDGKSNANWELKSTETSGHLELPITIGEYTDRIELRFYSNMSSEVIDSECTFTNIVFKLADMEVSASDNRITSKTYTTDAATGDVIISVPNVSPILVYNIDGAELSATYSKDINKHFTTVEDVTELPTSNINSNKIYNLFTATFIHNRHIVDNSRCYIVDTLPEVGEVATDVQQSFIKAYYNLRDNTLYGYLDETLAYGFSQIAGYDITAGWNEASMLFHFAGWSYAGVINNIGDDPNDSTIRLLLEKKIYVYDDEWIELTNSIVDKKLPTPDANGHFAYTVQRKDGVDAYELHLISHSINEAYKDGELMYPYQIPLRENGIIKAATPVQDLDVANKKYVDDTSIPRMEIIDQQRIEAGNPVDEEAYNTFKNDFIRFYVERNKGRGPYGKIALSVYGEPDALPHNFDQGETDYILASVPQRLGLDTGYEDLAGHIFVREDLPERDDDFTRKCATPKKYVDTKIKEVDDKFSNYIPSKPMSDSDYYKYNTVYTSACKYFNGEVVGTEPKLTYLADDYMSNHIQKVGQSHVPLRSIDGRIYVRENPIEDREATSKKYVDDKIGTIETILDNILLAQENIIGG